MEFVKIFFEEFIRLSSEMSPYLLLGLVFAGLLKVFVPAGITSSFLGKNSLKSVLMAALIGVPLPLCSCGVVPTGISLNRNGASKGATVSFLISTPQTGLDSILVTYSMLGLPFALLRPLIAFITGIFGGLLTNKIADNESINSGHSFQSTSCSCEDGHCDIPENKGKLRTFFDYAFIDFLQDIAKWLIIGLIIAALISVLLPQNFFTEQINNSFLGMVIMLVASVPLYICATSSVPVAVALMMKGLSPGAALVFLMAGPATNAATIMLLGKTLGKKTLFTYLFSIISGAFVFGMLINLLPSSWFALPSIISETEVHSSNLMLYFNYISAAVLLILIIFGKFYSKHDYDLSHEHDFSEELGHVSETVVFNVAGMSCSHCEASVINLVSSFANIDRVEADAKENRVFVTGAVDKDKIVSEIEKLGYKVDKFD